MPQFADRVKETTTTTGTGAITLLGAVADYQSFSAAFGTTTLLNVAYCIDDGAGSWEVGKGTLTGGTTLSRDVVRSSSNAGSLVNFAAGTKTVFCTPSAEHINNANIGLLYAQVRAAALQ